jgi:hypothetical protein
MSNRPVVFFAIPCGEFYSSQKDIIKQVEKALKIEAVIIEDHHQTEDLWNKIIDKIESAELFVADVSSKSVNVALELGYAIKQKPIRQIGIFISKNQTIPSDLQKFVWQDYSSFKEFQSRLTTWICDALGLPKPQEKRKRLQHDPIFLEYFRDQDLFFRHWSTPPNASVLLTHEGLRIASGNLPILTTTLDLLGDCEIEFKARIEHEKLGWVIKGTKTYTHIVPAFFVMLQIDNQGILTPHIWNENQFQPNTFYQIYPNQKISLKLGRHSWFKLTTRIQGDHIDIIQDNRSLLNIDFNNQPYSASYNDFARKGGQIGFRCHPNEEAVINYVEVRELHQHKRRK